MPGIAGASSPYPQVSFIMNLARARVNDAANDISGDLLANDQPYTLTYLNSAWRWLQVTLANKGVETAINQAVLYSLPLVTAQDTAFECAINSRGVTDGVSQYTTAALPADLILPKSIGVRQSGTTSNFCPMTPCSGALPDYWDCNVYDWRQDTLYYYGWQYPMDMKIRYVAQLAPLVLTDPSELAPILYCESALSARVAFEFANARGAAQAAAMSAMADAAADDIAIGSGRKNQQKSLRRQPYGRRSGF